MFECILFTASLAKVSFIQNLYLTTIAMMRVKRLIFNTNHGLSKGIPEKVSKLCSLVLIARATYPTKRSYSNFSFMANTQKM